MTKFKVLSTKKLDPLLIEQAKESNIEITGQEFISVKPITGKDKWDEVFRWINDKPQYIVFTSANAVESVKKYLHPYVNFESVQWKVFCLSGKTKQAVETIDDLSRSVIDTATDAAALAKKIIESKIKELVFFCGDQRRDDLPGILKKEGVKVHEVIVYTTVETPVRTKDNFDAILFFSPTAVTSFFSVNQLMPHVVCFAIGHTTAHSVGEFTANEVIVSNATSQEAMLNTMTIFFNQKDDLKNA
jgi:uroporphyrinogen-III synthase